MSATTHHPARERRRRTRLAPARPSFPGALLALIAGCAAPIAPAQEAPARGRDPWAFRLTLENRTRMLVVALRADLWAAYNPANGTLHKVWSGGIDFRGKVYDFGQRCSETRGTTYHLLKKADLLSATDESVIPAGWSAEGISTGPLYWTLDGSQSSLVSPVVNLSRHDRVHLSYHTNHKERSPDNWSSNNRLLVDISTDGGATWNAQQWMSVDDPAADGNQKLLEVGGEAVRVRFRRNATGNQARLADVALYGDYRAWSLTQGGGTGFPTVDWRGYRLIGRTEGIAIRYDLVLPGGGRIEVEERPEALPGAALSRGFAIQGLPAGARLSLELDGSGYQASHSVTPGAALRTAGGETFLDFTADGEAALQTSWTP